MKKSIRIIVILLAVLLVLVGIYFMMGGKLMEKFTGSETKVTAYLLPGCGWCEKFKPEWEKFQSMAAKEGIKAETVNAQEQAQRVTKEGVTAFPTVKVEKNGKSTEYNGDRTAEDLLKFAKSA